MTTRAVLDVACATSSHAKTVNVTDASTERLRLIRSLVTDAVDGVLIAHADGSHASASFHLQGRFAISGSLCLGDRRKHQCSSDTPERIDPAHQFVERPERQAQGPKLANGRAGPIIAWHDEACRVECNREEGETVRGLADDETSARAILEEPSDRRVRPIASSCLPDESAGASRGLAVFCGIVRGQFAIRLLDFLSLVSLSVWIASDGSPVVEEMGRLAPWAKPAKSARRRGAGFRRHERLMFGAMDQ